MRSKWYFHPQGRARLTSALLDIGNHTTGVHIVMKLALRGHGDSSIMRSFADTLSTSDPSSGAPPITPTGLKRTVDTIPVV